MRSGNASPFAVAASSVMNDETCPRDCLLLAVASIDRRSFQILGSASEHIPAGMLEPVLFLEVPCRGSCRSSDFIRRELR